ncbi:MAG TPA: hypothetical protein PKM97_09765 [Bacteroidia bacterium]|nr:hypothetical protein [Bacteroidia bacterium]
MKKVLIFICTVIFTLSVIAQSPARMSYQAVVRDASNVLVSNSPVGMRISILQGSVNGIPVYVETMTANTNANGLLSTRIGEGLISVGSLDSIDWTSGPYFLKTETDPTGGVNYTISGTSEMLSVPYALYAKTSGSSIPGPQGPAGADGLTTSVNNIQQVNGNITLSKDDIGLSDVDNTSDSDKPVSTAVQSALNLKANISSPVFNGTPEAPTAVSGTATNQIATTAFVENALASVGVSDATGTTSGKIMLAGDLGGQGSSANAPVISDDAISSAKILDGTISNTDISSSAAIPFSKLNISKSDITSLGIPGSDNDTQYGAGTGLSLSGSTFSIDNTVLTNNYQGTITAQAFSGDGSGLSNVSSTGVSDNSITGVKIVDGSITNADISASAAIPFSKLNISKSDITSLGIPDSDTDTQYDAGTGLVLNGTTFGISSDVVTSNYSGTVAASAFVGDGAGLTNIEATSVANDIITSAKIVDGTITNADISSTAAIPFSKLNITKTDITDLGIPESDTQYLAGTGLNLTGNIFNISSNVVTNNYPGNITANSFSGNGSLLTDVNASSVADNTITSTKILDNTISDNDISGSAGIAFSKLNISKSDITGLGIPGSDSDTQYKAGAGLVLTGDTFKIAANVVTNNYNGTVIANNFMGDGSMLTGVEASSVVNDAVTSAKIVDGSITKDDISPAAAIPFSKLDISKSDITSLGIPDSDTQYDAGTGLVLNGTTFSIAANVVTANFPAPIAATYFMGNGSGLTNVNAATLTDNTVTSAKIVDGSISNADISSSAGIAFSKLNMTQSDLGIYAAQIASFGFVNQSSSPATVNYMGPGEYQVSFTSASFSTPAVTATLQMPGMVTAIYSGGGVFTVRTYDMSGMQTDMDFHMMVIGM